jgi:hypothetical protein
VPAESSDDPSTEPAVDRPQPDLPAYYLPLGGGRYSATESCVGPWFPDAQHIGPPTALLVREIERCAPRPELQLGRITVEVLGPVPLGEVTVAVEVLRAGHTIELVGATVAAGGRPVLRAQAWRLATSPTDEVAGGAAEALPELPPPTVWTRPGGWGAGYLDTVEWRWLHGGFDVIGDGRAWARSRVPVVDGEQPSGPQRVAAVADSANGVAARIDMSRWLFLNTEITLHLHRIPVGEWVGIDAHTVIGRTGLGTVSATLFDTDGQVGRCAQQLTVRPRPGGTAIAR